MIWWRVLAAIISLYTLASLVPWIVARVLEWRMRRSGQYLDEERRALERLRLAYEEERVRWPDEPRPGPYAAHDRAAQQALSALANLVHQIDGGWPELEAHNPPPSTPLGLITCEGWPQMRTSLEAWRRIRYTRALLDLADQRLAALLDRATIAADIPNKTRAALYEARAETERLQGILDVEHDAGTRGLEDVGARLSLTRSEVEQAIDVLVGATENELPQVITAIDTNLGLIQSAVEEMDRILGQASQDRLQAQGLIARVDSSLRHADERWQALLERGATEPSVRRMLHTLRTQADELTEASRAQTLDAYREVNRRIEPLASGTEELQRTLDVLEAMVQESREAIEGDVQALASVQAQCDDLVKANPLIEPDLSNALIAKGSESYQEAERQRGIGTMDGYRAAIELGARALEQLEKAKAANARLPEQAERVHQLLRDLPADTLGSLRSRADRVREQLQVYAKHWDAAMAGDAAEAISRLEQVDHDLERISPDIRHGRRLVQSELESAIEVLQHAHGALYEAQELVEALEEENSRIEEMREELEVTTDRIIKESLPPLAELTEAMLPEVQDQFETLRNTVARRALTMRDPTEVDYDEATGTWLPTVIDQIESLRNTHESNVRYYQGLAREALQRLDRQWSRLNRMDPYEQPGPEEAIDALSDDMHDWEKRAEHNAENPRVLRELVGRPVAALEQRIENAIVQIRDGRRTLEALDREYRKHAQAIRALRESTRDMQANNDWPGLHWETDQAEARWNEAVEQEKASRKTLSLIEANNNLQQAVQAAEEAERTFARIEHNMSSALHQLDREMATIQTSLERGARRVEQLEESGATDAAIALENQCEAARRSVEMARSATSFEDSLRYLHDAQNTLTRV